MKAVAHNINEIKRRRENERTLVELQTRIEGYENLPPIVEFGSLLHDGKLSMTEVVAPSKQLSSVVNSKDSALVGVNSATFHFFLLSEALFYCKEKKKEKTASAVSYRFKGMIPMNAIIVNGHVDDLGGGLGGSNGGGEFNVLGFCFWFG